MTLDEPRSIGRIATEAFTLWRADWPAYLALAALVIVPSNLLVLGVGLGELGAPYGQEITTGDDLVSLALLLTMYPLVAAMVFPVVLGRFAGQRPALGAAIRAGLDRYLPALGATVLMTAAVAVGLLLLVIPGLIASVKLAVSIPAAVLDEPRAGAALARSWNLTNGSFWRVLGALLASSVPVFVLAGVAIGEPVRALAADADAYGIMLAGSTIAEVLTTPYLMIVVLLIYGDLRARAAAADTAEDA